MAGGPHAERGPAPGPGSSPRLTTWRPWEGRVALGPGPGAGPPRLEAVTKRDARAAGRLKTGGRVLARQDDPHDGDGQDAVQHGSSPRSRPACRRRGAHAALGGRFKTIQPDPQAGHRGLHGAAPWSAAYLRPQSASTGKACPPSRSMAAAVSGPPGRPGRPPPPGLLPGRSGRRGGPADAPSPRRVTRATLLGVAVPPWRRTLTSPGHAGVKGTPKGAKAGLSRTVAASICLLVHAPCAYHRTGFPHPQAPYPGGVSMDRCAEGWLTGTRGSFCTDSEWLAVPFLRSLPAQALVPAVSSPSPPSSPRANTAVVRPAGCGWPSPGPTRPRISSRSRWSGRTTRARFLGLERTDLGPEGSFAVFIYQDLLLQLLPVTTG
jgi:hypothetical protein